MLVVCEKEGDGVETHFSQLNIIWKWRFHGEGYWTSTLRTHTNIHKIQYNKSPQQQNHESDNGKGKKTTFTWNEWRQWTRSQKSLSRLSISMCVCDIICSLYLRELDDMFFSAFRFVCSVFMRSWLWGLLVSSRSGCRIMCMVSVESKVKYLWKISSYILAARGDGISSMLSNLRAKKWNKGWNETI